MIEPRTITRRALGLLPLAASALGLSAPAHAASKSSAPPTRGYAQAPFGLIHYRDTGKGRPLILMHQAPMSSQQYNTVYPLFAAAGVRAIGIDSPGYGNSDPTTLAPTGEEWARIVPAVMDHLGIKQADIAGHHTGSTVALAAAVRYPERIKSLTMHAALLVTEEERTKRKHDASKPEPNPYKPDGSHLTDAYMSRFKMYGAGADPALITRYTVERFQATGVSWHAHEVAYQYDSGAALKKIKTRTQVIGNSGDMIIDITRKIKELRPDIKYVEIPGGGVDITDQSPQAWVDAIVSFMQA